MVRDDRGMALGRRRRAEIADPKARPARFLVAQRPLARARLARHGRRPGRGRRVRCGLDVVPWRPGRHPLLDATWLTESRQFNRPRGIRDCDLSARNTGTAPRCIRNSASFMSGRRATLSGGTSNPGCVPSSSVYLFASFGLCVAPPGDLGTVLHSAPAGLLDHADRLQPPRTQLADPGWRACSGRVLRRPPKPPLLDARAAAGAHAQEYEQRDGGVNG